MLDTLGNLERTHTCGELRESHVGEQVVLMGWVAKKRDFGVFTFIDLRDRDGLTQIVLSSEKSPDAHAKAKNLRGEFVIAVKGEVVSRAEGTHNAKLATGDVEIKVSELLLLNDAKVPPFQLEVAGSENLADESTRLKYRYLDLRRPALQHNIRTRAKVVGRIREYMDSHGFIEIETPILLKSTPEGARDFIVPSRIHSGKFFALPQSPQILKQLTMIAGFDKYYQIARCFRDEDLRADRQPEFTQLDVEMSFANQEMVYRVIEGTFGHVFRLIDVELPTQFAITFGAMAFSTFVFDTLDVTMRLGRYLIQELLGIPGRAGAVLGTLITVALPFLLIFFAKPGSYVEFWTLFGASNQLLAALTLLSITAWLYKARRRIAFTLIPMLFVLTITLWALGSMVYANLQATTGVDIKLVNGFVSLALIGLAIFLVVTAWVKSRTLEVADPPADIL
jgi:hypothetical protein